MTPDDLSKSHLIHFSAEPPGQTARAFLLLSGLDRLTVQLKEESNAVEVSYSLLDYSLQGLEKALASQGFQLDQGLLERAKRAVLHYEEETQLSNLQAPPRREKTREAFAQAYEHHPHGDKDETPPEWREYK